MCAYSFQRNCRVCALLLDTVHLLNFNFTISRRRKEKFTYILLFLKVALFVTYIASAYICSLYVHILKLKLSNLLRSSFIYIWEKKLPCALILSCAFIKLSLYVGSVRLFRPVCLFDSSEYVNNTIIAF